MSSARTVVGAALLASLSLLAVANPGGWPAVFGAAGVLALTWLASTRRGRKGQLLKQSLQTWALLLSVLVALATVIGGHWAGALGPTHLPPPVDASGDVPQEASLIATLARLVILSAVAAVFQLPPRQLALLAVPALLGIWAAAGVPELTEAQPLPPVVLGLALTVAALVVQALALCRRASLHGAARAAFTVGVSPSGRGAPPSAWPALVVALVALVPAAAGISLPRLPTPGGAGRGGGARASRGERPPVGALRFAPQLDITRGRGGILPSETVVARVEAYPRPPAVLLLRGAALERATVRGFFARRAPRRQQPRLAQPYLRTLEVELTRAPESPLILAYGQVRAVRGLTVEPTGGGLAFAPPPYYPHTYEVDCLEPHRRFLLSGLPAALRDDPALLALPAGLANDEDLRVLATGISADGLAQGDWERARAIADWVRRRSRYDEDVVIPPGDLVRQVRHFLFQSRRGICTEYALTTAVLLRLARIPARVAVGYRTVERAADGRFVVRAGHAHAWVEVPLQGGGWVPLDPTSGTAGALPQDLPPGPGEGSVAGAADPGPLRSPEATPERALGLELEGLTGRSLLAMAWRWGTPIGLAALCLGWAWWSRRQVRRALLLAGLGSAGASGADEAARLELERLRERLFALLARRGFRVGRSETPLEFLERHEALAADPGWREALRRYTELRFAQDARRLEPAEVQTLDWILDRLAAQRPG